MTPEQRKRARIALGVPSAVGLYLGALSLLPDRVLYFGHVDGSSRLGMVFAFGLVGAVALAIVAAIVCLVVEWVRNG